MYVNIWYKYCNIQLVRVCIIYADTFNIIIKKKSVYSMKYNNSLKSVVELYEYYKINSLNIGSTAYINHIIFVYLPIFISNNSTENKRHAFRRYFAMNGGCDGGLSGAGVAKKTNIQLKTPQEQLYITL